MEFLSFFFKLTLTLMAATQLYTMDRFALNFFFFFFWMRTGHKNAWWERTHPVQEQLFSLRLKFWTDPSSSSMLSWWKNVLYIDRNASKRTLQKKFSISKCNFPVSKSSCVFSVTPPRPIDCLLSPTKCEMQSAQLSWWRSSFVCRTAPNLKKKILKKNLNLFWKT